MDAKRHKTMKYLKCFENEINDKLIKKKNYCFSETWNIFIINLHEKCSKFDATYQ